jgi:predicted HTH domain antitoxin
MPESRLQCLSMRMQHQGVAMNSVSVNITVPRDLLGALDVPASKVGQHLRELIAFELVREGRISTGKGAEMLGISKWAFIQLLAQRNIDYFTETPAELTDQIEELQHLLGAERS